MKNKTHLSFHGVYVDKRKSDRNKEIIWIQTRALQ